MRTIQMSPYAPMLFLLAILVGCETRTEPPVSVTSPSDSMDADPTDGGGRTGTIVPGRDGKDVVKFDSGNAAMDKATRRATHTLDQFFAAFSEPTSQQERFNLKVSLHSGARVANIWLDELQINDDATVSGVLLNQPYYSDTHQQGDRIDVRRDSIVDWSYIDDGYLVGGYTLRVMFEQYPENRREALQERLGYRIDPNKGT